MKSCVEQYAETGSLDAVGGAAIAYNQFMEAAEQALAKAKR